MRARGPLCCSRTVIRPAPRPAKPCATVWPAAAAIVLLLSLLLPF